MTTKFIPVSSYPWVDMYFGEIEWAEDGSLAHGDASAFSAGLPDSAVQLSDGVEWTWVATFTPEQEDEWTRILRVAKRKATRTDDFSDDNILTPAIATLKAFRNRSQDPNQQQTWHTIDAIIDVLRVMLHDN